MLAFWNKRNNTWILLPQKTQSEVLNKLEDLSEIEAKQKPKKSESGWPTSFFKPVSLFRNVEESFRLYVHGKFELGFQWHESEVKFSSKNEQRRSHFFVFVSLKVMKKDEEILSSFDEVPEELRTALPRSLFPPDAADLPNLHLERWWVLASKGGGVLHH